MAFEFELVPRTPAEGFDDDALAEMAEFWHDYPAATAEDGTLLIFPDEEVKAIRLDRYRREPRRNDYLTAQVHLDRRQVQLSVVGDGVTDRWLYDFAIWCLQRWPSELQYFGEPVPAEDILAASEH